jgi:hypothetical protein
MARFRLGEHDASEWIFKSLWQKYQGQKVHGKPVDLALDVAEAAAYIGKPDIVSDALWQVVLHPVLYETAHVESSPFLAPLFEESPDDSPVAQLHGPKEALEAIRFELNLNRSPA